MKCLVFRSWLLLFYVELVIQLLQFKRLHSILSKTRVRELNLGDPGAQELCRAMDLACVLYFKQVKCLQRSSATVLLLRQYGWKAEMVIGAQIGSDSFHAWVEISRNVVNDRANVLDFYQELERC
jgi:prolyl oligopeptidase